MRMRFVIMLALAAAPAVEDGRFRVPPIIGLDV